ncbi:hypothetical protein LCGC14_1682970 [marine sediment metagenome]|uniref:NAD-dependent epimerase/dehydratase domain-containing protein n=1 Tax=marine sediment metagenome TaxID=412755 RepID=A0A0F9KN21_9ZZZZ
MFSGKKVLVTGGSGMIGRYLVDLLLEEGADTYVVALENDFSADGVTYTKADLTEKKVCNKACKGMDHVFHLAGVKGSPQVTVERPASFMVPLMQFNLNMMEAAWANGVEKYLYTSSIGVYHPAPILREDDVWKTFPSPHDRCSGWAKRIGELQAEAQGFEFAISDRALSDAFIYINHLKRGNTLTKSLEDFCFEWLRQYHVLVYLEPTEGYAITQDGVRASDEKYQLAIREDFRRQVDKMQKKFDNKLNIINAESNQIFDENQCTNLIEQINRSINDMV